MAAMLSLLVLFAAISQCKAQYYGDGDGDSPSPTPPPPGCSGEGMQEPHAAWVQIAASTGSMAFSYTKGVTRDFTVTNTNTWGSTAGSKAGASFIIGFSSSGHSSAKISQSYNSEFMATSSTTLTWPYASGGVVWQFQFKIIDNCGTSVVKGSDFAQTIGAWAEPCCLPGFFKDAAFANGGCHGTSPVIGKVCNLNPTTTVAPWWPPSANDEFSGMQESQVIHFLEDGSKEKYAQGSDNVRATFLSEDDSHTHGDDDSSTQGGKGLPTPPPGSCKKSPLPWKSVKGQWVDKGTTNVGVTVTLEATVTHGYTSNDMKNWGEGESSGMSVGFSFCGVNVGAGSSSGSSNNIGLTYSDVFSRSKSASSSFTLGDGIVWQWEFVVEDQCGTSTVKTQMVGSTKGAYEKPCCLPGWSEKFDTLHGPCHGPTTNVTCTDHHGKMVSCQDPSCPDFTFDDRQRNGTNIV